VKNFEWHAIIACAVLSASVTFSGTLQLKTQKAPAKALLNADICRRDY